ncbi:magnesium transporter [Aneurinibacillus aneurinilyticus]|uniref:magnesium transporter n=1 Tax=Aneurinibacillus aneurinilyticus TaxID=1391 RepID=UPI0035255D57
MIRLNQYKFKEEYTYYMLQALKIGDKESFRKDFLDLHPMDQTTFFMELDDDRRFKIYSFLIPNEFGEIFSELDPLMQKKCILELDRQYAIEMLNELPPDDATDFFGLLSHKEADFYLERMEKDEADDIKQLLTYKKGSVGSLMTTDVVTVAEADSVADVLERLQHSEFDAETIYYLYVTDAKERLLGVISLRELIISAPECRMEEIMNSRIISVSANTNQTEILQIIRKYGLLAVPVVTKEYALLGIVTFDDVLFYM